MKRRIPHPTRTSGTTLIVTIAAIGVAAMFILFTVTLLTDSLRSIGTARSRILALAIANEQIELIRNLSYDKVGTSTGNPSGIIPAEQTVERDGMTFTVNIDPSYVDDSYDGYAQSCSNDPSHECLSATDCTDGATCDVTDAEPSDYKKVQISVCWSSYACPTPVQLTTTIAPVGEESASNTGTLILSVLDANADPVSGATVQVKNATTSVPVLITDLTNIDGQVKLYSLEPATASYAITVTKTGYSTDYTTDPAPGVPIELKPHVSIIDSQVTGQTLFIDRLATVAVNTIDEACSPVASVDATIRGTTKIDTFFPITYRVNDPFSTDASGVFSRLYAWDTYYFSMNGATSGYDIVGASYPMPAPSSPILTLPGSMTNVDLVVRPHSARTLRASVTDASTGDPISDATVQLTDGGSYDETQTTNQGIFSQTSWSGGDGQADMGESNRYASGQNIDDSDGVRLSQTTDEQSFGENFSTTTYEDEANTTAAWLTAGGRCRLVQDFGFPPEYFPTGDCISLNVNPTSDTVVQATLDVSQALNGQTIDYFLSADGGTHWEAVAPREDHVFTYYGNDLRWKAHLVSTSSSATPIITAVTINYQTMGYASSGTLTSSTFDVGPDSNYITLSWTPFTQADGAELAFQVASNTENTGWDSAVYTGPDGKASTYYTVPGSSLHAMHSDTEYFRYRATLTSTDGSVTPILSGVTVTHTEGCIPPGQVFFTVPSTSTYTITVTKDGYTMVSQPVDIDGNDELYLQLQPS